MTVTLFPAETRRPLAPRLLVSLVAALSLILGPLAFAPAQAATVTVSGVIQVEGEDSPEGASVRLEEFDAEAGDWAQRGQDNADENGAYEFDGVDSGARFRVVSDGPAGATFTYPYGTGESAEFEITDVATTAPVLSLTLGGTISGTVGPDGAGTGIEGARVIASRLRDGYYQYERETDTDEGGTYSVVGLRDGVYRLQISARNYLPEYYNDVPVEDDAVGFETITITDGTVVIDKNTSLTPAAVVRGEVSGPDGPLQGIVVSAYRKVTDEDGVSSWQSFQRYDVTDEGGSYAIDDLPAGTYRIGFVDYDGQFVEEFYNNKTAVDAVGVQEFTLATGETAPGVNALLAPAGFISGTLVGPAGDKLDSGCAFAYGLVDGQYRQLGIPAFTEGSDEYVIRGLAAGTYKVMFDDCSGEGTLAPEYFDNQTTLAAARELTVTANQTLGDINGVLELVPVVVPVVPPAPPKAPAPAPVAKKSATVSVSAKGAKKKATLTITVKASGVTPTGKVTIKLGNKTLKTVTLKGGKAKVTLTKQKKGKRTYKITYSGDAKVRAKSVNTSKVTIK